MIRYYNTDIQFSLKDKRVNNSWLKNTIISENKLLGNISIIFCSDDYLLSINKQFLNHDYYTDIITFDYCDDNIINGDLFISIDTVKANSFTYKSDFDTELARVMVHGVLHLIGYNDYTPEEQSLMRSKENQYLELR